MAGGGQPGWRMIPVLSGLTAKKGRILMIHGLPPGPVSADTVRRYQDLGVHRLVLWTQTETLDDLLRSIDQLGEVAAG